MTDDRKDRIESAAVVFVRITREKQRLASIFGVTGMCITQWTQTPEFHAKLDELGYTGERSLILQVSRDIYRDTPADYETAKTVYIEAYGSDVPKHKLIDYTAKKTGLEKRRLRYWAKRFDWKAEAETLYSYT